MTNQLEDFGPQEQNPPIQLFEKNFTIDWEKVKTLDDVIAVLKSMQLTVHWKTDECPDQFKEIYDKGFLTEMEVTYERFD